jgi:hypothetical protein
VRRIKNQTNFTDSGIIEDELLEEKLDQLNKIFDRYKDKNCYVNLFAGRVADERGLFCRADAYNN